jgi:lysophospholipase L1-like esterase
MHTPDRARALLAALLLLLPLLAPASRAIAAEDKKPDAAKADTAKPDAAKAPPFDAEIRAFEAADAKSPPAPGGVLFVGSSSIRLWKTLAEDFPGVPVINRGFGGSQIPHSTRYADRIVLPYKPKTIVFYAGDNDIAAGRKPEQVLADFKAFAAKVHDSLPDTPIYFISIKPSLKRWKLVDQIREANRLVKELADSSGGKIGYVDVFTPMLGSDGKPRPELLGPDGLHMTRQGYELWRDTISPLLREQKR